MPWGAAGEAQGFKAGPAGDFDVGESEVHDRLKRREQVGVSGEQDQGVVLPAEVQVHHVDGDGYVDALFPAAAGLAIPGS